MGGDARSQRILVVGAGPTGLTAALELARRGFAPRLVDAESGPSPAEQSRALAVNVRTLELLEPSGAIPAILAEAQQVRQMRLRTPDRRLASIDTTEIDHRYRGLFVLPQGTTERILLDRLAALGIAPEWNTRLAGFETADLEAPVVRMETAAGTSQAAPFDIVIGADGAHSQVRKSAGLGFPGEALTETFHLADFTYGEDVDTSYVEACFFDPGVLGRLPVDRRTLRYVSTLPGYRSLIAHPAPVVAMPWSAEFKVSFRHVAEMRRGRVFLAGDAAHIHSPIGGRGMNLGIEDACWLAWLIAEGREDEYSALRMPAVRLVMADTRRNTRLALMSNPLALAARNLLMPLVTRMGFLRRRGVAGALGLDTPPPPWLG